jgi:hypothetical protein
MRAEREHNIHLLPPATMRKDSPQEKLGWNTAGMPWHKAFIFTLFSGIIKKKCKRRVIRERRQII